MQTRSTTTKTTKLGRFIENWMKNNEVDEHSLAVACNRSITWLRKILSGHQNLQLDSLQALAEATNTNLHEIVNLAIDDLPKKEGKYSLYISENKNNYISSEEVKPVDFPKVWLSAYLELIELIKKLPQDQQIDRVILASIASDAVLGGAYKPNKKKSFKQN